MTFESAVEFIFTQEGGHVDDPQDPGGETNFGISARAYPDLAIKDLSRADAMQIYRRDFWAKCRCGELPHGVDLLVFDAAVNQGPNAAIKMLQRASGVEDDGILGPATIVAARAASIAELAARRMVQYGLNPNFTRYGLGWSRRLMQATARALKE